MPLLAVLTQRLAVVPENHHQRVLETAERRQAVQHVRLFQALSPRGELPQGWIWRPLRFNARLRREERSGVMAWCYLGGFGFVIICLGLLLMAAGVAMALIRGA